MRNAWLQSLRDSKIDPKKYILHTAIPSILGSSFVFILIYYLMIRGGQLDLFIAGLFLLLEIVIIMAFVLLPFINRQNRRRKIEQEMHLFITRVGVLSTSDISRKGIFDIALEMKEYGELAIEINKIFVLLDTWGLSIGDACRRVAKSTPSVMFGDFLERLAYAVESGEEPKDFFAAEQEIILEQYKILYAQASDTIAMTAEIFIAIIMVMTFLLLIVALIPFILGIPSKTMFYLSALLFVAVECLMLYMFIAYVPTERVWQDTNIKTRVVKNLHFYFIISVGACFVIGIILFGFLDQTFFFKPYDSHKLFHHRSFPITMALTLTPLMISGYYTRKKEREIIRTDNNFAAFIRSLGSTSETSSIAPVQALKRLRWHDFGPLTRHIEALYDRVNLRIDPVLSWKYFGAETGSDLITKFSGMFVRGLEAGGKPGKAAQIISFNFTKLIGLRKRRYTIAASLSGLFIGIAIVLSLVMFMAGALVEILRQLITESGADKSYIDVQILQVGGYDVGLFVNLMFVLVIFNAAITSLIHVIVAAGHKYGALFNFVVMVWIGAFMSEAVPWVIIKLLAP